MEQFALGGGLGLVGVTSYSHREDWEREKLDLSRDWYRFYYALNYVLAARRSDPEHRLVQIARRWTPQIARRWTPRQLELFAGAEHYDILRSRLDFAAFADFWLSKSIRSQDWMVYYSGPAPPAYLHGRKMARNRHAEAWACLRDSGDEVLWRAMDFLLDNACAHRDLGHVRRIRARLQQRLAAGDVHDLDVTPEAVQLAQQRESRRLGRPHGPDGAGEPGEAAVEVHSDGNVSSEGDGESSGGGSDDGAELRGVFGRVAQQATPDPTSFGPMTKAACDALVLARLHREGERVARIRYAALRDAWIQSALRDLGVVFTCEYCEARMQRIGRRDADGHWYCSRCWWDWDPSGQGFTRECREKRELDCRLRKEFEPSWEEYLAANLEECVQAYTLHEMNELNA